MGVTISEKKNKKMIADIERAIGRSKMNKLSHQALLKGAQVFVKELEKQFETFKDTGASIDDITISGPEIVKGAPATVRIHWNGAHGRYRIIHLNEWGTVQNPNPRGKGAVARAIRNAEVEYARVVKQTLKDGL